MSRCRGHVHRGRGQQLHVTQRPTRSSPSAETGQLSRLSRCNLVRRHFGPAQTMIEAAHRLGRCGAWRWGPSCVGPNSYLLQLRVGRSVSLSPSVLGNDVAVPGLTTAWASGRNGRTSVWTHLPAPDRKTDLNRNLREGDRCAQRSHAPSPAPFPMTV